MRRKDKATPSKPPQVVESIAEVPSSTFSSSSGNRSTPTSSNSSSAVEVLATNPTPGRAPFTATLAERKWKISSSSSDISPAPPTKKQKKSELVNNAPKKKSEPVARIHLRNIPRPVYYPKETSTSTSSDCDSSPNPPQAKPVEPKTSKGGLKTVRRRGRGRGQFKSGRSTRDLPLRPRAREHAGSVEVGEQISKKPTASKNGASNNVALSGKRVRRSKAKAGRSGPPGGQNKSDPYIAPKIADNVLFNAALYGGYTMHCLPPAPVTEEEKRIETQKVFGYYREEIEAEKKAKAEYLARTKNKTASGRKVQNEDNPGVVGGTPSEKPQRDLSDFDSYDVLGKIVEPDGTTRHLIEWKTPGIEDDSDDSGDLEK